MQRLLAALIVVILTNAVAFAAERQRTLFAAKAYHVVSGRRIPGQLRITRDQVSFKSAQGSIVVRADEIQRVESDSRKERASVGTIVAFGIFGALAGKRNFTTIGIEKTDGEVVVFAIKGKESMEYVMAIERLAKDDGAPAEIKATGLRCPNGHEYPPSTSFEFCPEDGLRLGGQADPAPTTGSLVVTGAMRRSMLVFVDGVFQGRGSASVSLEPGWHSLEIRPTVSGDNNCWEEEVSVEPGETTTIDASESCGL